MKLGTWNGKELSVTMTIEKQVVTAKVTDDLAEMMMTLPIHVRDKVGFCTPSMSIRERLIQRQKSTKVLERQCCVQ